MALTSVENKICSVCGADVRPNALFCYGCGNAVSDEKKPDENFTDKEPVQIVSEKNEETVIDEKVETTKVEKPDVSEKPKLKSAAAMRRKSKSFQNKKVEVFWEEHENAPNVWFISVAVALTIVAVIVLFLASRLK